MRPFIQLALCALVAVAAMPASAKAPITGNVIEASADSLSMPASANGVLVVARCAQCPPTSLQATVATQYVIAGKNVTLKEFSAFARSNGSAFVAVFYEKSTQQLTRLQASLPVPPSTR
jgi:hypothetical protein